MNSDSSGKHGFRWKLSAPACDRSGETLIKWLEPAEAPRNSSDARFAARLIGVAAANAGMDPDRAPGRAGLAPGKEASFNKEPVKQKVKAQLTRASETKTS